MIERYSRPEMKALWTEDAKYASWAEVEKAHLATLVEQKSAPDKVLESFEKALQNKTPADFYRREQETGHDVIAFVAEIGDAMGKEGSFLHMGLTSSDVVDTSLSLRTRKSLEMITNALQKLRENLAARAFETAQTPCIGRTHGIHAEPISFGQVLSGHFAEFQRAHKEILEAQKAVSFGKLSGAVGSYSQITPAFEKAVLSKLSLQPEPLATQVIPRDRLVKVGGALLAVSHAIERFALNVRHLARTEIGELQEAFGKRQKGSSAMPHKKNPILAENLCGLARTVRGYVQMLSENVALWHERDISHSSVERIALPDLFVTLDFMLGRCSDLITGMQINTKAMEANLWRTGGLWASQSVLTALVTNGMNRTEAYELIQNIALKISAQVITSHIKQKQFLDELLSNEKVTSIIDKKSLASFFETEKYLLNCPLVFRRVYGISPEEYSRVAESQKETQNIPALQKIIKVTVSLLPDVLDTEAKTITNDMISTKCNVIDLRQQKSFIIRIPTDSGSKEIKKYALDVLHNPVMEQFEIEVLQ